MVKNGRRSLPAEPLKPTLARVEKKAGARCYHKRHELQTRTAFQAALGEDNSSKALGFVTRKHTNL